MIFVRDIINICSGKLISGDENVECINFCTDSRLIKNGDVYVGIKGENFNGNNFYMEAIDNGASVCILDKDTPMDRRLRHEAIILVDDTIKALQELAKYKRSLYDIPVIAVTGSVGKTSVKDMIYTVVSSQFKTLCTKGNLNNHIGVPLTILGLKEHEALIVEMGMNHQGEISVLSKIAMPTMAIITNIGTAHIGNLGSRENILKAKLEILDGMNDGTLIINNDNDMLRKVNYDNLVTIGIDNNSDYIAKNINDLGFSANFCIDDNYIEIPVGSKAFIYNSLFAYAVGVKLGIDKKKITKALESFMLTSHRLEVIKCPNYTIIDDTYNASLDSVKNALSLMKKANNRRVFIFGDILELDEYGEEIHKEIGNSVIENKIDLLITVGSLTKYTYDIVVDAEIETYHFDNNQDLICKIDSIIKQGDIILVKGSHVMNLVKIVEYLKK